MFGVVETVISSTLQILALMSEWQDENHKKTHLKLATSYLRDTANMWKKVFWSYETNIELFDLHANTVWRKSKSEYPTEPTIPMEKHAGGTILQQMGFFFSRKRQTLMGKWMELNTGQFRKKTLLKYGQIFSQSSNLIIRSKHIHVLKCPSQSLDQGFPLRPGFEEPWSRSYTTEISGNIFQKLLVQGHVPSICLRSFAKTNGQNFKLKILIKSAEASGNFLKYKRKEVQLL